VAAGLGFGAAVAGFAVHDRSTTATTVTTSGDSATTPTTTPSLDQFDDQSGADQFSATPGFGSAAPDSTSRGS